LGRINYYYIKNRMSRIVSELTVLRKDYQNHLNKLHINSNADVFGPESATDTAIARYDTITGKLLQDSLVIVDDVGKLTAPILATSNYTLPSNDGSFGQQIITDGSGNLSFSDAGTGNVIGPASSTDNAVARYDTTTGELLQDSLVTVDDVGKLTAPLLATSNYYLPAGDGTVGQALTTDGVGVVGFSTVGNVIGPASSTDNAVARYDTTTGELLQDSLVTVDDVGKLTAPSLATSNYTLPTSDGSSGQMLTTNGGGVLSFSPLPTIQCLGGIKLITPTNTTMSIGVYTKLTDVTSLLPENINITQDSNWTIKTNFTSSGILIFSGGLERASGNLLNYNLAFFKNNILLADSIRVISLKSGDPASITSVEVISYTINDIFDIRVAGITTADDIFCSGGKLIIR